MERWKESQINQLSLAQDMDTAYELSMRFANSIGFDYCSFSTSDLPHNASTAMILRDNYPAQWSMEYTQRNFRITDPVVAHCHHSIQPVLWRKDLYTATPLLWNALEFHDMQHGWSQSVHDENRSVCSILSLSRKHHRISAFEMHENLGFSVLICRHLHALAVKTLPKLAAAPVGPHLSVREIDVLKLAAAGKTAGESARILNVTPRTINFHVQNTIIKFGVTNKISAVMAATREGYLGGQLNR